MFKIHTYTSKITWDGNLGEGTKAYDAYSRNFLVDINGKQTMHCSSDVLFRGDGSKYNPEDFLLMSISSCHMLWYLHYCADNGIIVTAYEDTIYGDMEIAPVGGKFISITLKPIVTITDENKIELAKQLHHEANKSCFIANTLNIAVNHEPVIKVL